MSRRLGLSYAGVSARPNVSTASRILDRVTANVSTSGAVETTVYTFTVVGNVLGTAGALRLTVIGQNSDPVGVETYTWRLKYGATTLFSADSAPPDNNAIQRFRATFYLVADGATNSQIGWMDLTAADATSTTNTHRGGTAAIDSTVGQALAVSIQGTATAGEATLEYAVLELL